MEAQRGGGADDQDCAPHGFGQDLFRVARVDAARGGYPGDAAAKGLTTKIAHRMASAKIFFVWRAWTQYVEAMAERCAGPIVQVVYFALDGGLELSVARGSRSAGLVHLAGLVFIYS